MSYLDWLISLRSELLVELGLIKKAHGVWSWDTTRSNYSTRQSLGRLVDKYVLLAKESGVLIVTRYLDCDNDDHSGYPTKDRYGLGIAYRDPRFRSTDEQLFQGRRDAICPCSEKNKLCEAKVIDDFVYELSADIEEATLLAKILESLNKAHALSLPNKARVAIREQLLLTLLQINDAILPQAIDDYIATHGSHT